MSLNIQIQTIAYTFLFGIYFALIFNLLYKILFTKNFFINLITNFLFLFLNSSFYFYLLYKINDGIIHIYSLLIFLLSFFLYNHLFKKIRWIGWGLTRLALIKTFWYH